MALITAPTAPTAPTKKPIQKPARAGFSLDMHRVASIVLGGGQGTRLFPLTETRCKPAICFGGRYRLIDVPVSNTINSHCTKIFVVTQFLSSTLHRHIFKTYHMDAFSNGFIEILAAEQKPSRNAWFQGTADAVRQNLEYFIETPVDYFFVLSGDQLYNFDFQEMVRFARTTDAELTIATLPIDEQEAKRMGVLKINEDDFITDFYEKPQEPSILEEFTASKKTLERLDLPKNSKRKYLGSMGIYLFKRDALIDLLTLDPRDDFGKHLIPTKVKQGKAASFLYDGYWEDIGTIDSFYKANISLTQPNPPFNLYNEANPVFTNHYNLPGPKISHTSIKDTIICEGSIVEAAQITSSILGPRSVVKKGTLIKESYVMGNDFYTPPFMNSTRLPNELHIGENCVIKNAIIDKNVHIGNGVQLINKDKLTNYNGNHIFIRDGIIIVSRGAQLPEGFVL